MTGDDTGLNGILLIDKPGLVTHGPTAAPPAASTQADARSLLTSHDVVQQVRRAGRQRRIGHTGTLDPMASGLLVLCLGWATRLVEYYQGHAKGYRAEITLGFATDTYDVLGEVTERLPVPRLAENEIEEALAGLRGSVMQTPPVYSALKQGGESIHYKARRGEDVTVAPRAVEFHEISLIEFARPDRIVIDIRCSAGAYIRSLAVDLGRLLGTAATLTALRRTAAGPFGIAEAITLDQVVAAGNDGGLAHLLLPPGARLDLPAFTADEDVLARLGHGQAVRAAELREVALTVPAAAVEGVAPSRAAQAGDVSGHTAQIRGAANELLGILRSVTIASNASGSTGWRADKWFS